MDHRAQPAPFQGESGFTLLEMLITIVVLAVGGLAIVGAMTSSVLVADAHRGMAEGEVVARDFVEAVRDQAASNPWPVCPTAAELDPDFERDGWTATILSVRYWAPGAGASSETWPTDPNAPDGCHARYDAVCGTSGEPRDKPECDPGVVRVDLEVVNDRTDVAATTVRTSAVIRRGDGP